MDIEIKTAIRKTCSAAGSFDYVNCPVCNKINILGGGNGWVNTICKKCKSWIKVKELENVANN